MASSLRPVVFRPPLALPTALVEAVRTARRVAVYTGAGVSAESGIPTFRGALTGLWNDFDPQLLATADGFQREPRRVWEWYQWRRGLVAQAQPNAGHLALARLETRVPELTLITQNIDDLHERAGSRHVLHLHGKLFDNRCFAEGRLLADSELNHDSVPPRCRCGSYVRPGVVWFEEVLPEGIFSAAEAALRRCDLCLVVGTSALVWPAAGLVHQVPPGATRVVVNLEETEHAEEADYVLLAPAGQALPALVAAAFGGPRENC